MPGNGETRLVRRDRNLVNDFFEADCKICRNWSRAELMTFVCKGTPPAQQVHRHNPRNRTIELLFLRIH